MSSGIAQSWPTKTLGGRDEGGVVTLVTFSPRATTAGEKTPSSSNHRAHRAEWEAEPGEAGSLSRG